jgi:hypothetical protein
MQSIPASRISERSSGKDADDVGAPADLAVETLKRVGGPELAPVRRRERVEGQDVGLSVLEHRRDLPEAPVEVRDGFRKPIARLFE